MPYVDRSRQLYNNARRGNEESTKEIAALASRVAKKAKPDLDLKAYAGTYQNPIYGPITVEAKGKQLLVRYSHHPGLTATLDYMDNSSFRTTYSNAAYGIFPANFIVVGGQVKTLELRVNSGLEQDPYLFVKQ